MRFNSGLTRRRCVGDRRRGHDGSSPPWSAGSRGLNRGNRPAFLILALLLPLWVGDATPLAAHERFPIVVSGGAHSLTVPWHPGPVAKRLNPILVVGSDRTLKPGRRTRLYQTANVGFFQHYWWMTGLFLDTELGVGWALPLGFQGDLRAGVGYLHYFWRRKTLELKDGKYVRATDWGRPSIFIPMSVVLGYRGSPAHPLAASPFFSVQWAIQAPFIEETPAMTHFLLLVGVRIDRGNATRAEGR